MKRIVVLLFFSAFTCTLYSQRILTFEEAVKIALRNGVLLNQQKNNLDYSQMQKVAAMAAAGPSLQLNSSASEINGNSFNPQVGAVVNGIRDNVTGSISGNINLFSGFYRINSIRQYVDQLEAQSYYVKRTSQDLINTVATQYLQVMLDVELVKIARENFDALDKQYQQVKEQVGLGARSQVDEYNQDAQRKGAELRFVQAEVTLASDKALLAQTLLIDPLESFDVEAPNWDANKIGVEQLNPEELSAEAKRNRGDYLRAVKNEEAQKFAMRAARGLMMPSLYAFGSYGSAYNYQHDVPSMITNQTVSQIIVADPSAASGYSIQNVVTSSVEPNPGLPRPFSEQFRKNNTYKQYGLQLTIPLFAGLQNRTTYVQQRVLYENNQVIRKNLEYQIRNDVVRAVKNYEGARKAFAVTIDQLSAAHLAFQFETERYNLGVTDFVAFSNANRVLVQAQTDKAQAEYRLVFQKITIGYAVGSLKEEDLQEK